MEQVIDVRAVPRSRHNPQFGEQALRQALTEAGLAYEQMKALGGLRHPRPDSPNAGWRNESFRGYADYMQTAEFEGALEALVLAARRATTVIMCAEAVPWRCHRSLVADALLARGHAVEHIMGEGVARAHLLNPMSVVSGGRVSYPAPSDGSPA